MFPNSSFAPPAAASRRWTGIAALLGLALLLGGCAGPTGPRDSSPTDSPWAQVSQPMGIPGAPWELHRFPGKHPTDFSYERLDGRDAIRAQADSSASLLRQMLRVPPERLGSLSFSWKVPDLIANADMTQRDTDDSPVRVMLAFDGDHSRFTTKESMMSELSRMLTGEDMPYATLMYVWSNKLPVESTLHSPRTDRIRKIVLESGSAHLGQWLSYERDIRADFERCYGEAPGPLIGVAVMTDTDNTQSHIHAWYGPIRLKTLAEPAAH